MRETLRNIAVILIVITAVSLAGCAQNAPPAVGASAPDFTLMNQDGKPVSLKDYRGKWVVLYFYAEDFGQRSTRQARSFQADLKKFDAANAVVLGSSGDAVSSHKAFADEAQLHFTLLADVGLQAAKQYGALQRTHVVHTFITFSVFVIDPQGKVARTFSNSDPNDPSGQALSALNALQQH